MWIWIFMFHHYFLYFLKMTIKLLLPLFNFPQDDFPLQWKSVEQHLGKFLGKSLLTLENWLPHATHQVQIPDSETQAALCLVALAYKVKKEFMTNRRADEKRVLPFPCWLCYRASTVLAHRVPGREEGCFVEMMGISWENSVPPAHPNEVWIEALPRINTAPWPQSCNPEFCVIFHPSSPITSQSNH